jgi:hypothetical protein
MSKLRLIALSHNETELKEMLLFRITVRIIRFIARIAKLTTRSMLYPVDIFRINRNLFFSFVLKIHIRIVQHFAPAKIPSFLVQRIGTGKFST